MLRWGLHKRHSMVLRPARPELLTNGSIARRQGAALTLRLLDRLAYHRRLHYDRDRVGANLAAPDHGRCRG